MCVHVRRRHAMPTPAVIGKLRFKTIKAATAHTRSVIRTTWQQRSNGVATVNTEHPDFEFFRSLVQGHPNRDVKFKGEVLGFEVRETMNRAALGVYADVAGHGMVNFSFLKCCGASPPSKLLCAMRRAVRPSVLAFRVNAPAMCELCDASHADMHVDHENPTFKALSTAFLAAQSTAPPDVFDDHPGLHMAMFAPGDSKYEDNWKRYHDEHASLRVLCSTCNLSRLRH